MHHFQRARKYSPFDIAIAVVLSSNVLYTVRCFTLLRYLQLLTPNRNFLQRGNSLTFSITHLQKTSSWYSFPLLSYLSPSFSSSSFGTTSLRYVLWKAPPRLFVIVFGDATVLIFYFAPAIWNCFLLNSISEMNSLGRPFFAA